MYLAELYRRLRFLITRNNQRRELETEMRMHRDLRKQCLVDAGMPPADADREASRIFGNETLLKEKSTDMWQWIWLDDFTRDLRLTARMLAANRGFTVVSILTLALAIGANSAIFTVTNSLLLQQMPVPEPQQVYKVTTNHMPNGASNTGDFKTSFSYYVFDHLQNQNSVLSALVAYVPLSFNKTSIRSGAVPEEASIEMVSGNFFSGLGISMACGRALAAHDASTHTSFVAVNYAYAAQHFGNPCSAVGSPLFIKGAAFTIVGVTAHNFQGVEASPTDVWIPLQSRAGFNAWGSSDKSYLDAPDWWCLLMMARLRPGISPAAAEQALKPAYLRAAYDPIGGKPHSGESPTRLLLVQAKGIPGSEQSGRALMIIQVMVGLLLAIACANVSMLLAVRNAARAREFALRLALGGSRSRLLRQLLAESLVLVIGGAVLGFMLLLPATRVLGNWADLERPLAPDGTVVLFTFLLSGLAVLFIGLGPAFGATRTSIVEAIKNSATTAFRDRSSIATGNIVTALQMALCLLLLVGMGLLVRTLQNLTNVPVGFHSSGLVVFGLSPQVEGADRVTAFYRELLNQLRSLPQVESVTLMGNRIASGWSNNGGAFVDGQVPKNVDNNMLRWNEVGPDFLRTLGMPLLAGRDFTDADNQKSAPVAIVNRTFVERFLKGQNALGHTASYSGTKPFSIVGIVENSKYSSLDEEETAMAWFPYTQVGDFGAMQVELRTRESPLAVLPQVRAVVAKIAPDLALLQPRTQQAEFDRSITTQRLLARLALSFAALAIVFVAIGLYGTISYRVKRRTSELGIRLALGAERASVVWMVMRSGMLICAAGLIVGIPLVWVFSRYLASLLFGVTPLDPFSILAAVAGIFIIDLLATWMPATRAAAIDPMIALRVE